MEIAESQKTETKQVERNPNRGMSKKERRRVEALKQKLEPRIQKLETQVLEQIEKVQALGDKRKEGTAGELASKGAGEQDEAHLASPSNETSKGEQKDTEADKQGEKEPEERLVEHGSAVVKEKEASAIGKLVSALQAAGLGDDPVALKLVADLAALNPRNLAAKARASHLIQPSGGGIPPAPDLRAEYEKRVNEIRPGDIDGLMEVKREFRKRGLEVY